MLISRIEFLEEQLDHAYDPIRVLNEIAYEKAKVWFVNDVSEIEKWISKDGLERRTIIGKTNRWICWYIQLVRPDYNVLIDQKLFDIFENKFRLNAEKTRAIIRDWVLEKKLFI